MKNLTLTIALLLSFQCLLAQNWAPFTPGETHHFQSDTANFPDRSVRIDSVRGNFADSLWHFNRLFAWESDSTWGLKNQPFFCGRKARVHSLGLFQLFDPGNIALYTLADSGDTWLLDSIHMRMGFVARVYEDSVFGVLDSLKVILVDSLDSLVLSKAHGMLSWPALLGPLHYTMVGIQERHVGDTLPGFAGFFPYAPGSTFYWHSEYTQADNPGVTHWEHHWKMHVDSTTRSTTELVVYWSGIMMGGLPLQGVWHLRDSLGFMVRRSHQEQVEIGDANLLDPYAYPFQSYMLFCPGNHYAYPNPIWSQVQLQARNDSLLLHLGGRHPNWAQGNPIFSATAGDTVVATDGHFTQDFDVAQGVGMTHAGWTDFETSAYIHLVGYIIAEDTVGTIWPDSVLLANPPASKSDIQLWPNPATDFLHLRTASPNGCDIAVMDLSGKSILSQHIQENEGLLDLRALPAGMYLARIAVAGETVTRRLVIAH